MKRFFLIQIMIIASLSAALAQNGLQVDKMFDTFGHSKGCKMVEMHNSSLRGYKLNIYKSLTYKKINGQISQYLKQDRQHAKKIREVIENGNIVSGYYMMKPLQDDINRYILFSNTEHNSGVVIYIEGRLSPDEILKLVYSK